MTLFQFALRSAAFYRRTHAAVVIGVGAAVGVLAGSLLVGASVRTSLAALATERLGRTNVAVVAERPFGEGLAARLLVAPGIAGTFTAAVPLVALDGLVRHESSNRRAGRVSVYGVDEAFFRFHGSPAAPPDEAGALLSPALADELGAASGDAVLVRVARPTDIPADSLHGKRDDIGRTIRLRAAGTIPASDMGEFSLAPGQGPVRAVFIARSRLSRDLDLDGRANTVILAGPDPDTAHAAAVRTALSSVLEVADFGVTVISMAERAEGWVESSSGLIPDAIAATVEAGAARAALRATPILTWLANAMTVSGRSIPYSIVTALGPEAAGDATLAGLLRPTPGGPPPIVLNAWAAADLKAAAGDALDLEYYRWTDDGRLVTERSGFRVAGVVPMAGLAVNRRLAPTYPGITESRSFADWDPPFPIDLRRVRPADEEYWDRYRTSPKAFVALDAGQRLWRSRHGQLTSIRLRPERPDVDLARALDVIREDVARDVSPVRAGINIVDVRRQNLQASAGATDFGAYFAYFSFFLMAAALLLAALFLRLGLETRQPQMGVLRAAGYPVATIRKLLLLEGAGIAGLGALLGAGGAVGWAALMMYGLRTWWVGAVGTSRLQLDVDVGMLLAGAAGGAAAAIVAVVVTVAGAGRMSPRALMTGAWNLSAVGRRSRARAGAAGAFVVAVALSTLAGWGVVPAAAAFFGAGTLVLVAGLAALGWRLGARHASAQSLAGVAGARGLVRLGLINASWRPGRSLTAVGLVAAAVFLLVSVEAFRKRVGDVTSASSGTGGFAIIAESELPVVHDPSSVEGRLELGLQSGSTDARLAGTTIVSFRLRPGDDTSCLNLYQPTRPRIVGVPDGLIDTAPFRFARSIAATDAAGATPWRLLGAVGTNGVVPAIVDATSLQYVLHASVGDVITIDADTARPIELRIVASLDDTVLQGEILISERAFRQLFPDIVGFRMFLVGVEGPSPERVDEVTRRLEDALADYGFDAEDTARRLAAFHRVENTYLSTFQALGGLGLALGCLGLVAVVLRNVLERRRELALLGAAGFTGRDLQVMVASEHVGLVAAGVIVGLAAALVAVAPVALGRTGMLPWSALAWLIPVVIAGLAAALGATRSLRRLPLVPSLRRE